MASTSSKNARQQRAEQMRREREKAEKRRRNGITLGIMAVVVVLVAVAAWAVVNEVGKSNEPAVAPSNTTDDFGIVYDQEAAGGEGGDGAAAGGDAVPVVIYEDFQCPVCKAFEEANGQFLDQQVASGAISIEYRPIAFLDRPQTDNYSSRAANAAACVMDAGGAPAFHELQKILYTNQSSESGPGLTDDQINDYVRQAGVLEAKSCIDDGAYDDWVVEATDASRDADVSGTPTILVDGKVVTGQGGNVPQVQDLQQAITAAAQG